MATEEIEACTDKYLCDKTWCVWADWSHWSPCTKSCGTGRHKRRRSLYATTENPEEKGDDAAISTKKARLFERYQALSQELEESNAQRWQDLAIAFVGGCMVFFLIAVAMRMAKSKRQTSGSYALLTPVGDLCQESKGPLLRRDGEILMDQLPENMVAEEGVE
jgi:hypothetical protein